MKIQSALVFASALAAAAPAYAAMPADQGVTAENPIVQVWGGCGPYGHRGPYGGCRPGGQAGGYRFGRACPPGFHLGRYGRRCWPNY
jgi:hypothetical protein